MTQLGPIETKLQQINGKQANSNNQKDQKKSRFGRVGLSDKTLWDWLNLFGVLLVPLMIGVGTIVLMNQQNALSQAQHKSDQSIAAANRQQDLSIANEQQQESILKTFRDDMKDLIDDQNLFNAKKYDHVRVLAWSYTNDALRRLDTRRKDLLVRFLIDLGLVNGNKGKGPIISLWGTELKGVNLVWTNLNEADLSYVDLTEAELTDAVLSEADLGNANLFEVNLRGAALMGADLSKANLTDAKVTPDQLSQVSSLSETTMPDGTKCILPETDDQQEQTRKDCVATFEKHWNEGWRPSAWI